jgi:hypothetical protein
MRLFALRMEKPLSSKNGDSAALLLTSCVPFGPRRLDLVSSATKKHPINHHSLRLIVHKTIRAVPISNPLGFVVRLTRITIIPLDSPDSFAPSDAVVIVEGPTFGNALELTVNFFRVIDRDLARVGMPTFDSWALSDPYCSS